MSFITVSAQRRVHGASLSCLLYLCVQLTLELHRFGPHGLTYMRCFSTSTAFVLHRGWSQRLQRADCVMICAIFCKGLGHLWILVPARGAGTDPLDSEGQLTFLGSQRWMQSRVAAPNPYRVKGQLYISYNVKFLSPLTFLSNEKM